METLRAELAQAKEHARSSNAAADPVADRAADFAELRRQLDVADADITLVNKRLDEAQAMYSPMVNIY